MNRSVVIFASVATVCLGWASVSRATIVDVNEDWMMKLQPGETVTAIAHFIPDVPDVMDSLIFPQAPEWVEFFVPDGLSWDTALADEGRTAYLYGPAITNNTGSEMPIFSYRLYYQWDDEDPNFDENYPVYLDVAVFNEQELIRDFALRGIPNGPYDPVDSNTWSYQNDPLSPPYENPVPVPGTIALLGLGAVLLRKRR